MAFNATNPFNVIAMIGFILSALTYLSNAFTTGRTVYMIIGMIVITSGYIFMFSSKFIAYLKATKDAADKKNDTLTTDVHAAAVDIKTILQYLGYATLAVFFIGTFFFRQFTIHYRFYDFFAAAGYSLMTLTKFIPITIPLILVILYYFFGCLIKIWDDGIINKTQMVARFLLLMYYTATIMSVLHLF